MKAGSTYSWMVRALAAVLAIGGFAVADAAPALADSCPSMAMSSPFAAYNDSNSYFLAPGGDFSSSTAGWTFSGGATVVQDPAAPSGYAAYVPPGGSITTPAVCVSSGMPTSRMFGYTPGGNQSANASLQGSIVYSDGTSQPFGNVPQQQAWGPTRKFSMVQGQVQLNQGVAWVQFQFTAGNAAWEIDDIYVDPRMRH